MVLFSFFFVILHSILGMQLALKAIVAATSEFSLAL